MPRIVITDNSLKGPVNFLLDDPDRIQLHASRWQGFIHYREKKLLDKQMYQAVSQYFQEHYHIEDRQHFERIWNEVGAKIWSSDNLLTVETLKKIDQAFRDQVAYCGSGISPPKNKEERNYPEPAIQQVVKGLLHGGALTKDLIQRPLLEAVFVKKDPKWLTEFRFELQYELDNLAANPPKNPSEKTLWDAFLGNIVAFLPFSYPEANAVISIPQLEANGSCRKVDYRMDVIELTPASIATPISAIGLTPVNDDPKAPPMISFIGTTYPAGDGFAATVMSDFTPGMSVGEAPFHFGRDKIEAWMQGKKNVHAIGTSLGGALVFHTLLHHHSQLSRVDVYNPPGLYENCWKGKSYDDGCAVNIYCQSGDLVSKMGSWPTGSKVKLYRVLQGHPGLADGIINSHARAFTGCEKVAIIKKEPQQENQQPERKALTALHRFLGPWLVFLPMTFILGIYRIFAAIRNFWTNLWSKRHKETKQL